MSFYVHHDIFSELILPEGVSEPGILLLFSFTFSLPSHSASPRVDHDNDGPLIFCLCGLILLSTLTSTGISSSLRSPVFFDLNFLTWTELMNQFRPEFTYGQAFKGDKYIFYGAFS
jgi:hypothetical protein